MLVDSHCHLDFKDFEEDGLDTIVSRAADAGVGHMVTICTRIAQFPRILHIANQYDNLFCTVGTHPHQADEEPEKKVTLQEIVSMAADPKVVGIGETGLDYYYDNAPRDTQKFSFRKHIHAAQRTGLPLVIHSRETDEDMVSMLREEKANAPYGAVMHCFSSGPWLAEQALDMGFYISFSGILTFKKAEELRDIAKTVPLDRILVETDSPYLAPVPMRGSRNEPAFVVHTAEKLAEIKGVSSEEIASITTQNFFTLFSKAKK